MINREVFNIEKLSDNLLENVSGGLTCKQTATVVNIGVYTAIGTGVGAISCAIAGAICSSKAAEAQKHGNIDESIKYNNTSKYLSIAAASLGGVGIAAATTGAAVSVKHGNTCTQCAIGKPPKSYQN